MFQEDGHLIKYKRENQTKIGISPTSDENIEFVENNGNEEENEETFLSFNVKFTLQNTCSQ